MSTEDVTGEVEYREIPEAPGYRFGRDGSVQTRWSKGSKPTLTETWRTLTPSVMRSGHLYAWIRLVGEAKVKLIPVHKMILWAFIGKRPDGLECLHKDGNPANNVADNLSWGTRLQNVRDQQRHGVKAKGEKCGSSKLTADEVREIRRLRYEGHTLGRLAKQFGVSDVSIHWICTGKSWRHVL